MEKSNFTERLYDCYTLLMGDYLDSHDSFKPLAMQPPYVRTVWERLADWVRSEAAALHGREARSTNALRDVCRVLKDNDMDIDK